MGNTKTHLEREMTLKTNKLRDAISFALVGTIATFWEFAEWTSDHVFGTNCQMRDLDDTLLDQLMGLVGAAAFLLLSLRRRAEKFLRST